MPGSSPQLSLPRIGRGVKILLAIYAVIGIGGAIAFNYVSPALWAWLTCAPRLVAIHPWTLLTAGLLTNPTHWSSLLFTLFALYFLGPDLERRWGTWRLIRFVAISIIAGFGLSLLIALITPAETAVLHPDAMFGPNAAMSALAVAWGRENADSQIRLYMILPISGKHLVWITLGFCVLGVFFPASVPEGVPSPFGGFIAGWVLSGSPSPIRSLYLRAKLLFLRSRGKAVRVNLGPEFAPKKKRPAGAPPLRIVSGGLDDDLGKRQPPKDKRYLN